MPARKRRHTKRHTPRKRGRGVRRKAPRRRTARRGRGLKEALTGLSLAGTAAAHMYRRRHPPKMYAIDELTKQAHPVDDLSAWGAGFKKPKSYGRHKVRVISYERNWPALTRSRKKRGRGVNPLFQKVAKAQAALAPTKSNLKRKAALYAASLAAALGTGAYAVHKYGSLPSTAVVRRYLTANQL